MNPTIIRHQGRFLRRRRIGPVRTDAGRPVRKAASSPPIQPPNPDTLRSVVGMLTSIWHDSEGRLSVNAWIPTAPRRVGRKVMRVSKLPAAMTFVGDLIS